MDHKIPRDAADDYAPEIIATRRRFIQERTGASLEHVSQVSFDPHVLRGNIENFTGAIAVPLGFAGPLLVDGEHAKGDFYVPMATTEGTLLASYSRGMRVTREVGGVTTTIADDAMQRGPVFGFASARGARDFGLWIAANFAEIKRVAETSTSVGKLRDIQQFAAARFLYLRFNFTTGDAAGQNMSSKATSVACEWIREQYTHAPIAAFTLSGNVDTDKKASRMIMLHSRGKRVIAEVTIPDAVLQKHLHVRAEDLFASRLRSTLGALMADSVNNGSHAANALAAIFIATGQDPANVAESHVGFAHVELLPGDDLYYTITLPSVIVASYGGGTGLPSQRECLEAIGCYGTGKVRKLAEIVGATVLCGELSLGSAVVANQWVDAHERLGRNRP